MKGLDNNELCVTILEKMKRCKISDWINSLPRYEMRMRKAGE